MLMIIKLVIDSFVRLLVFVALSIKITAQLLHRVVKSGQRRYQLYKYAAKRDQTAYNSDKSG